ncbi:MAG: hypothetical protein IPI73_31045 [Betaproteobacteria bacterium]|nr:hypothetical protein [Betaproteobacteria bacterium]
MFVREAMAKKFGLGHMALEGGDIRQVEVQAPRDLPAALATGLADAAALIHSQAWRACRPATSSTSAKPA